MPIQIVTPKVASEALDHELVELTRVIADTQPRAFIGAGVLGGNYGYGANFENDVFEMHCDGDIDCTCPENHDPDLNQDHLPGCPFSRPNFRHKASGFSVWWYKWIGRGMETKNEPLTNWRAIFEECRASLG